MNKGKWISDLIEDYKKINSEKLKLGQAKWLQNDYVKFIRFCQWKLKGNIGIMALITDHSYVDSSTFVGMRASLISFFNTIYILNLHGNAKRNKNIDDDDENVFDITQGVSIIVALKNNDNRSKCFVYELRGDRNFKYSWLVNNNLSTITWEKADISPPYYLFKSSKLSHVHEFSKGIYFPDIVQPYWGGKIAKRVGTGFVTTHDSFAISWDARESILKVFKLLDTETEEEARKIFRLCSQAQWNYFRAKKDLSNDETWKKQTVEVLYRPFDFRWTIWNSHVCVHRRLEANAHLLDEDNIALCIGQAGNVIGSDLWSLALITKYPVDFNLFYRGGCGVFPAYLIDPDKNSKSPNLSSNIIKIIENRLDLKVIEKKGGNLTTTIGIYDVFSYLYAILYSGNYRRRYSLLLDVDYPRIPFTSNKKQFSKLSKLGTDLVSLHLMRSKKLDNLITEFKGEGDNIVAAIGKDSYKNGKLSINKTQYFEGIPEEVYNFYIGGYQVCQKWLKDRKGRQLTEDEIEHYQKIVVALHETIRIMNEIDEEIEGHGGWPVK